MPMRAARRTAAAHVVAEREERAAVRAGRPVQRDAGQDRAHRVLADAEVQRAAVLVAGELVRRAVRGQEGRLALHRRVVRAGEVGRAAPQLGQHRCERREDLAGRGAGRDGLAGREDGQDVGPAVGQLAGLEPVEQRRAVGVGLAPRLVPGLPVLAVRRAAVAHRAGVRDDLGVDVEGLLGVEAEDLLEALDLVAAELGAVRAVGVLLGRRRPGDDRAQADERRARRSPRPRRPAPRRAPRRPRGTASRPRSASSRRTARASRTPRSARRRPR